MKALTGILVVALAACSTPSEIVKTGPNAYRVRTDAGGGTPSDAEIKTRGIARANEFCDAQGKRAVINVGQSGGWHLVQPADRRGAVLLRRRLPPRPATSVAQAPLDEREHSGFIGERSSREHARRAQARHPERPARRRRRGQEKGENRRHAGRRLK